VGRHARRLAGLVSPGAWYWSNALSRRWVSRRATGLDALTPTLAGQVEHRTGRTCSVVLPAVPEPDPSELAELPAGLLGAEGSDPIALFTGTVWPAYVPNLVLGLRAVALVRERGLRLRFVHAGRVHPRLDVERLGREAGLPNGAAVTLGQLPFRLVPALLERGTVLLQPGAPSDFNRFGLPTKLMSYLRSGRPTITFAAGPGELLDDRDEVLKTHTGDPRELADRIYDVLTDRELRERLERGGPAAARRLFDPVRNTDSLIAHSSRALGTGASAPEAAHRPKGAATHSSPASMRSIDAT
jgi:glycosyltransferase involved in cell wall biosynthesis